ncbi:MAG: ABC transporter substrate-binding protein [Candidatus Polarisedimenticolaceae bacterium]|nr:ABC transporter substrate-binding protein [Candidatus Polarisedimenticolaceae bacterium]
MNRLLTALFALLISAPAWAEHDPQHIVKVTSEKMLSELNERREEVEDSSELLIQITDEIISPYFDFARISRLALGKYWRKATPEQRKVFSTEFHTLLLRTYSKALLTLGSEEIKYPNPKPSRRPDRVTIPTLVKKEGSSKPVAINYKLYQKKEIWKVYDIAIDGVSLVANYRSQFATQIKRKGVESLILALQERNQAGSK